MRSTCNETEACVEDKRDIAGAQSPPSARAAAMVLVRVSNGERVSTVEAAVGTE